MSERHEDCERCNECAETMGTVMRRAREAFLVEVGRVMGPAACWSNASVPWSTQRGFDSVLDERLQDAFEHAFVGACAPYVRAASRGVCAACGRVPEL